MNNWKKIEAAWINLDFIVNIWIDKTSAGQYCLKCLDHEGDRWEISTRVFNDIANAQNYLDKIMETR